MQKLLFPEFEIDLDLTRIGHDAADYISLYQKYNIEYEVVEIEDATFKSGTNEPIHSWFRLTPSYSPELVRYFLNYLECKEKDLIFDPFNGKGTTIIECQRQGYRSAGVELNPLLYNVTAWSLQWDISKNDLETTFDFIKNRFESDRKKYSGLTLEEFCQTANTEIPAIHNPFRWWQKPVLKELLILKYLIFDEINENTKPLFKTILGVISLDCANIHRNHPTISFDDNHNRLLNVWLEFETNYYKYKSDLSEVNSYPHPHKALIIEGDSTKLEDYIGSLKIDRIITSPPYPNRFSYIHQTRPQLFFMDLLENTNHATDLDLRAVGGTWGRATSVLQKEFLVPNDGIADFLYYIPELKGKNLLMCNYATKYFNMMHDHIKSLRPFVNNGFRGVYVVGNSRLNNVEIHTEVILAKIFELEGFKFDKVVVFRKRGGRKKLYETGVCVSL